jgi:hypothetical protein
MINSGRAPRREISLDFNAFQGCSPRGSQNGSRLVILVL